MPRGSAFLLYLDKQVAAFFLKKNEFPLFIFFRAIKNGLSAS